MHSKETIRVGVVGAGDNTRTKHIPLLRAIEGVEIVAVANRRPESTRKVAADFGIPRTYDNWRELVDAPDVDAVMIGTWPNMHAAVTIAALDAGKHVLCEARMAATLDEALEMHAAARRNPKLVSQIVPSPFTLHADRTISRLLREGFCGKLLAVELHVLSGRFADFDAPLDWRQDRARSGINIMFLGIWYEAITRWIGTAKWVMAQGVFAVPERLNAETGQRVPVEIPDYLSATSAMECGVPLTIVMSAVAGGINANEVRLLGTEGTLRFADGELCGQRRGESQMRAIEIPPSENIGWRVEEEFIGAIRGEAPVELTTLDDALKYMRFTDAVVRSIAERRRVDI